MNYEEVSLPLTIGSVAIVKPSDTQSIVLNTELQGAILAFQFGQEVVFIKC